MRSVRTAIAVLWMLGACAADDTKLVQTPATVGNPMSSGAAGVNAGSGGVPGPISGSGGAGGGTAMPVLPGTGGGGPGSGGVSATGMGTGGTPAGTGGMSAMGTGGMSAMGSGGMPAMGTGGMPAMGTGGMPGTCTPNLACKLTAPPSSGDIRQDCVDRINQFRVMCACLPAYERWKDGEACADQMAMYDTTMPTMPHAGAIAKICGNGQIAQDECPGWPSNDQVIGGCLQSMWDEGPPPTDPCDGACFEAHGHFINMSSKTSKRVACGFATNAQGQIWAVQNFSY